MKKSFKISILIIIFLVSFLLMFFSARSDSATTDESIHLFAGFTYLTQNDFRLDPEHPPLIKEIAALPLLALKPHYILGSEWQRAGNFYYDSWKETRMMSNNFLYSWGNNPEALLILARVMMIILTLALGLSVFFYARKLYGINAGIFAAFMILFLPIVIAHGRLINTDIGVTLFSILTIFFWSNFLKKQTLTNFIFSGVFLGLALASKYTAAIFVAIMLILLIIKWLLDKKIFIKLIFAYLGTLIIAFAIIWAAYGFSLTSPPPPEGGLSGEINSWSSISMNAKFNQTYEKLRPFFVPADFFKGLSLIGRHVVGGNGAFLLGHNSTIGWWYYFLVAIFFKTPIALFIFIFFSLYYFKKVRSKDIFDEYVLILSAGIFLAVAMLSRANLGIRHVLPIFPFVIIFASKAINAIDFKNFSFKKSALPTYIFCGAIVWYLAIGLGSYPNYLAYFNEFSGGSNRGYKLLTDSNLDWGQDVFRIKNYLEKNNIQKPYIVYPWGGELDLKYYNIDFILLTPEMQNVRGKAVVSATYYDTDAYAWLRKFPKTQISAGVFLVELN